MNNLIVLSKYLYDWKKISLVLDFALYAVNVLDEIKIN